MGKRSKRMWVPLTAAVLAQVCSAAPAGSQAMVLDVAVLANTIQQLAAAKNQLEQMKTTHDSWNKLTNMGDIAGVLNDPKVRQALPQGFANAEQALMGRGAGASGYREENQIYAPGGNAFYQKELERQSGINAGQMSVAQQLYDTVDQRRAGIKTLQDQISQAGDPKTIADLQARLQVEMVHAQNDMLSVSALRMIQQALVQAGEERRREATELYFKTESDRLSGGR